MEEVASLDLLALAVNDPSGLQGPLHARVKRVLRNAIDEQFENGQRFWPENQLIESLGVSQVTVRRALTDLAKEGVLNRGTNGSFVQKSQEQAGFDITCLVIQHNSDLFTDILELLGGVCREGGRNLRLCYVQRGDSKAQVQRQIRTGSAQQRFVIVGGSQAVTQDVWSVLSSHEKGAVAIDTPATTESVHFVGVDNIRGIRIAMEHLRQLGHRRIMFLSNEPGEHPNIVARKQAFLDNVREWDLKDAELVDCNTHYWEDSHQAAIRMMPEVWRRKPTAIITASDQGAWGVLGWLAENGISVPGEVSVLGFGNARPSQFTYPSLTCISHPNTSIVRWAVELLETNPAIPQNVRLEPQLVMRRSTGPVPLAER